MNTPKRNLLATTLALVFSVCVLSGPALAQDTTGGTTSGTAGGTTGADRAATTTTNDDHHTDYGWLGLLGLAGLAGLTKKPKEVVVHDRASTNTGTGTGVR